jgi:hypothetical protein
MMTLDKKATSPTMIRVPFGDRFDAATRLIAEGRASEVNVSVSEIRRLNDRGTTDPIDGLATLSIRWKD